MAQTAKAPKTTKKTMNIKPLFGNVLIKPLDAEDKTPGGIILPDTVKDKPQMGTVMAVGDGAWDEDGEKRIKVDVKVGQKVMYKKWGGNEIKVDNEEWTIVDQKDILAIVE
jgi:chaperonin GroES